MGKESTHATDRSQRVSRPAHGFPVLPSHGIPNRPIRTDTATPRPTRLSLTPEHRDAAAADDAYLLALLPKSRGPRRFSRPGASRLPGVADKGGEIAGTPGRPVTSATGGATPNARWRSCRTKPSLSCSEVSRPPRRPCHLRARIHADPEPGIPSVRPTNRDRENRTSVTESPGHPHAGDARPPDSEI